MSRAEAKAEALRLAEQFLAVHADKLWLLSVINVAPYSHHPQLVGKTPSRWIVGTAGVLRDSPGVVFDGCDPAILVDLVAGSAEWLDETEIL